MALDALIELAVHGEYNGQDHHKRTKDSLELRGAAATVFEVCLHNIKHFSPLTGFDLKNFVNRLEIRLAILQDMLPPENSGTEWNLFPCRLLPSKPRAIDPDFRPRPNPLLLALSSPPNTTNSVDPADVISTHIATLMFSHLLRGSSRAKSAACDVMPSLLSSPPESSFFVPADGAPPGQPVEKEEEEEEDGNQTLLQVLSENLSLGLLSRSRATNSDKDAKEWDRYVVGHLCLLSQWLWEDPKSVRGFLDAGGLGVVSVAVSLRESRIHAFVSLLSLLIRLQNPILSSLAFVPSFSEFAMNLIVNLERLQGQPMRSCSV